MNNTESMNTQIKDWFEAHVPGYSDSAASIKAGIAVSTARRHIGFPQAKPSMQDTVVTIARAYGLPVVDALIACGLIDRAEAEAYAGSQELKNIPEKVLLHELLRRVEAGGSEELTRPITAGDIEDALTEDPNYEFMSVADAKDYGLAANSGEEHIEHDASPHEP